MKNLILIFALTLHCSLFTLHSFAQLPEFTMVDTGAIYNLSANEHNLSAMIFDADNDGDFDPVIAPIDVQLNLYRNERNAYYKPETFLPETTNAFIVTFNSPAGDIDNDGDCDIVGQKKFHHMLGVFRNDGYGNFSSDTVYYVPNTLDSFYPVLLDFNSDGLLDLLRFDTAVVVLYNDGEGRFENKTIIGHYDWTNNIVQHSMSLADVDNDGDMDVYCGMTWHKNLFFLNTGTSLELVEEDHITVSEDEATHCVNWVDYDNDGDMDLFTVDNIFENLGSMEFVMHKIVEEQYDSDSVWSSSRIWGDLDNDGDQDLFLSVEHNNLLNNPAYGPSAHPYNILYLNEGNGEFVNILNHALTSYDSHTAEIFDHNNDGFLDVLTIGNAWVANGHNMLFENQGNDNSYILINCIDKYGCSTPYGTRITAKTMISGVNVLQIRELNPVDGNLSFGNTRIHFGFGDAEVIDTLIFRWPSGHVDTYFNVAANQIYNAIEDHNLEIDFKATNYIQYSPGISDLFFEDIGEITSIDLKEYYHFIKGDTVPVITGDTLTFSVYGIEEPGVVSAEINGSLLSLKGDSIGETSVQILVSAGYNGVTGFTERVDQLKVKVGVGLTEQHYSNVIKLSSLPNPFSDQINIKYEIQQSSNVRLDICNYQGQVLATLINKKKQTGAHEILFDWVDLPAGVYFLVISTNNGTQTTKIIKL